MLKIAKSQLPILSMSFEKAIRFIDSLDLIIHESIKETFRKYDFVIVDYLTNKQWFQKGEDSKGKPIEPEYTAVTVKIKKYKGDPYNRVTLRNTGKLYKSIDIIAGENAALARVSVDYFKGLEEKYGKDILGIQVRFLVEFTENYILPTIKKNINDSIAAI